MKLKIDEITVRIEYLPRKTLDIETIERYKEAYDIGEKLPPIVVQKEKKILIDGFHRFEAQKRLGYDNIEIDLMDIPEDEIYLTSIELNRRHGLPFSREDRDEQIRKLRFERAPPLTYEKIGKAVGRSTSRVGEICREMEFKINGPINTIVDARNKITPEQTEEIQDRLEAGEPTSEVAKDYPVGESRVSQLKKRPKTKKFRLTKSRPSRQGKPRARARMGSLRRRYCIRRSWMVVGSSNPCRSRSLFSPSRAQLRMPLSSSGVVSFSFSCLSCSSGGMMTLNGRTM